MAQAFVTKWTVYSAIKFFKLFTNQSYRERQRLNANRGPESAGVLIPIFGICRVDTTLSGVVDLVLEYIATRNLFGG